MKLTGVMIGSPDAAALHGYYTKLFGAPSMEDGGFAGWDLGGGWLTVGPHDEVSGANASPGRVMWILESSDVPKEFDRLRDAGATVVREPYSPDAEQQFLIATFADPDGNYFQLMSAM